jgi:hypothetical protein
MSDEKHEETPLERSEHAIDEAKEAAVHFHATERESATTEDADSVADRDDAYENEPAPQGPDGPAPGA